MKYLTLNLTNPIGSEIAFEVSNFPDGQQQVKILGVKYWQRPLLTDDAVEILVGIEKDTVVTIKARLNNFRDLELIMCATWSLRELGVKIIHLYCPYFLGCRSDRKFEKGINNYLKNIICPVINSMNYESVTVIDPHSDVLEACLNNFEKKSNLHLVAQTAIPNIIRKMDLPARMVDEYHITPNGLHYDKRGWDKLLFISPDAGANKKIFKIADDLGYTGDIVTCTKSRDENGKLTRVEVPLHAYNGQDLIIIDDICDGGATFIGIAERIKEITKQYHSFIKTGKESKIYLIVTHGIFSKGLKKLNQYFDGIYCTNSYVDMHNPIFNLENDKQLYKLYQENVF